MPRVSIPIVALGAALLAGPALAQGKPQPTPAQQPAAPAAGGLTRSDFITAMDGEFHKRDANGDGFITRDELQQYERNLSLAAARAENARIFAQLDKDRNGMLSASEFGALVAVPPAPDVMQQLDRFDQNHDQKITIIEHRAATLANFDRLDNDLDGIVTDAEMKAGNVQPTAPTQR